jgi:hypothetical protein
VSRVNTDMTPFLHAKEGIMILKNLTSGSLFKGDLDCVKIDLQEVALGLNPITNKGISQVGGGLNNQWLYMLTKRLILGVYRGGLDLLSVVGVTKGISVRYLPMGVNGSVNQPRKSQG